MIYLEIGASVISIMASLATIVSYLKTRKKRGFVQSANQA